MVNLIRLNFSFLQINPLVDMSAQMQPLRLVAEKDTTALKHQRNSLF